ncbi:efflux transporter outer membrane subunit [Phenylobacterium sp. LjRoot225]|uniref:efflux transporter outer membrane subunit n=1 Tax=Phenylobacterium sp. LjRoot225 TaxID=3342285 RepID=UPI003ECD8D3D
MLNRLARSLISGAAAAALCGCAVGPDYVRPSIPVAPAYKEQAGEAQVATEPGWNPARPADLAPRGDWWALFNDATLNGLEARVAVSNQNVAAAEAAYRQAEALVREQRAALLPTLDLSGGATRSGGGSGSGGTVVSSGGGTVVTSGGGSRSTYRASVGASWEADVWGRIRRGVESARGSAQASEADLAAAKLSAQATLAANYFDLRQTDLQIALLQQVTDGYKRALQITQNRFNAGIAPHSDLLQAQSQLASAQADLADLSSTRAAFEHAIAVLVGETPESFSLAVDPSWSAATPDIPAGVPSTLLQRRPDIAAAERRAAAASAQIGVETAAWFPSLTLTGSYGFSASALGKLFSASTSVWSLGASAAQTLFDAGATRARVSGTRAAYDQSVAEYRQTVLAAFQDVEDQLAAQRALAAQHALRRQAAEASEQAATMMLNQYKEGQVAYTDVVTAQATALTARRTFVQTTAARQTTAVALVQALGGGWTAPF